MTTWSMVIASASALVVAFSAGFFVGVFVGLKWGRSGSALEPVAFATEWQQSVL